MMEKINVIFLDIDGVLNGFNFWNVLGWRIVFRTNNDKLKGWYRRVTDPNGLHKRKVRRLAKIVRKTDAKIVLSSAWRLMWGPGSKSKIKLENALREYDLSISEHTPILTDYGRKRCDEILAWLSKNEEKVNEFVILDDELSHLKCFKDGRLVLTASRMGTGLSNRHVRKAIKILKGEKSARTYKICKGVAR